VILERHDGIEGEGTADEGAHDGWVWAENDSPDYTQPVGRDSRKIHAPDSAGSRSAAMLRA